MQSKEQKRNLDKLAEGYITHLCGESQCDKCKNFIRDNFCKAFPNRSGIPVEIRYGEVSHTKPYKGDNGIQFEPLGSGKKGKIRSRNKNKSRKESWRNDTRADYQRR